MVPTLWFYLDKNLLTCRIDSQKIVKGKFTLSPLADSSIEAVSFEHNKNLTIIPDNIAHYFPNVIGFQAFNCSVEIINEKNFKGLKKLRNLNLSHNKIQTIQCDAFIDLNKLEFLTLSNNKIKFLCTRLFSALENLRSLFFYTNEIKILHSKTFHSLHNLEHLNLNNNEIQFLPAESIFETLTIIKNVSLGYKKLEFINENLFVNNTKLEKIWLRNNKIKSLSENILDGKTSLHYIDVRDNECINKFYWAKDFENLKTNLQNDCKHEINQILDTQAKEKELSDQLAVTEIKLADQIVKSYDNEEKIRELNEKIRSLLNDLYDST